MTVYKTSLDFARVKAFAGIVFDCDGVLIDSSKSYDQALLVCTRAFATLFYLNFDDRDFMKALAEIRKLGEFNNDWDSQAIMVYYLYSKATDTSKFEMLSRISQLNDRLTLFESLALQMTQQPPNVDFGDLINVTSSLPEGTNRDQLARQILKDDSLCERLSDAISYPKPVGVGFLSTLFDEVVYGREVFKEMYGLDCATKDLSNPGLIINEKKLIGENALVTFFSASNGNLGIITGRPRVPTLFTMGDSFQKWFRKPELCLFTGDYILEEEEVKPSAKPMLKVASRLSSESPILYVGDSGEDLLMTKNVNKSGELSTRVYFAAIASSEEKAQYFESERGYVDCIVSDINELGSVIEENSSRN